MAAAAWSSRVRTGAIGMGFLQEELPFSAFKVADLHERIRRSPRAMLGHPTLQEEDKEGGMPRRWRGASKEGRGQQASLNTVSS